jgi:predicted SAM-dependent methyltransferase
MGQITHPPISPEQTRKKPSGHTYSYRYPRNIISWFFLAQRHNYVRSILHNSVNLDIGANEHKVTSASIGVDVRAEKRPNVVCSVMHLPFVDESFDTCTMLEVIEHMDVTTQKKALEEVHRVLKDEGQFIISTPNLLFGLYRIIWWFWERTAGRQWFHEHVGMMKPVQVQQLLLRSGFRVLESKRIALLDRAIDAVCHK